MRRRMVLVMACWLLVLPMSVKIAVTRVALNTSIGTQDIVGPSGFGTPKGAIAFVSWADVDGVAEPHSRLSIGFTDGVRDRCADYTSNDAAGSSNSSRGFNTSLWHVRSGGGTLHFEAVWSAWITDGIRVNATTASGPPVLATVVLIGGDEPQVYVGTLSNNSVIGGTNVITAPGFTPHTIFFAGANTTSTHTTDAAIAWGCADRVGGVTTQRSAALFDLTSADTSSLGAYFSNAHACKVTTDTAGGVGIDITSFDALGFTSTTRDVAVNVNWAYMCVTWGTRQHGLSTVFTPTTVSTQSSTWPGFKPQGLLGGQQLVGSQNTHISNQNAGGLAVTCVTPAASYCTSINGQDNVATTNTQSLSDNTAVNLPDEAGAALLVASLTNMTGTGYDLNYTAVSGSGRAGWWFAVEEEAGAGVLIGRGSVVGGPALVRSAA